MFICSNCGYGSQSWIGKCPHCNQWNTMKKVEEEKPKIKGIRKKRGKLRITNLKKSPFQLEKKRQSTGIYEFDRVLGGGFVNDAVTLVGGEPGIGKSTLLLQLARKLRLFYLSGEESLNQTRNRAERLKLPLDNILFSSTTETMAIINGIEQLENKIDLVIIDSIQTLYTDGLDPPSGTVSQIRESTKNLVEYAKKAKVPVFIIGHITKEGIIAGPKTLEHLVDCVLIFEGDKKLPFRILRAKKNRFGPVDEIGIFTMKNSGLIEISNPTVFIDKDFSKTTPGKATIAIIEGKRPLFIQIEALVVPSFLAMPRRVVKGVNYNKVLLLLAVIRKYLRLPLDKYDLYINVVGGLKITSPAADLGIIASLLSIFKNKPLPQKSVFIGEVGLLGEVRDVYFQEKLINEAKRLGFTNIFNPRKVNQVTNLLTLF